MRNKADILRDDIRVYYYKKFKRRRNMGNKKIVELTPVPFVRLKLKRKKGNKPQDEDLVVVSLSQLIDAQERFEQEKKKSFEEGYNKGIKQVAQKAIVEAIERLESEEK